MNGTLQVIEKHDREAAAEFNASIGGVLNDMEEAQLAEHLARYRVERIGLLGVAAIDATTKIERIEAEKRGWKFALEKIADGHVQLMENGTVVSTPIPAQEAQRIARTTLRRL